MLEDIEIGLMRKKDMGIRRRRSDGAIGAKLGNDTENVMPWSLRID